MDELYGRPNDISVMRLVGDDIKLTRNETKKNVTGYTSTGISEVKKRITNQLVSKCHSETQHKSSQAVTVCFFLRVNHFQSIQFYITMADAAVDVPMKEAAVRWL